MFNVTVIRRRCTSNNTHLQGGHDTVVSAPGTLGRSLVPLGRSLQEERGRQASEYGGMLRHEGSSHVHTAGQTHRYCRRIRAYTTPGRRRRVSRARPAVVVGRAGAAMDPGSSSRNAAKSRPASTRIFYSYTVYTSSAAALQTQTHTHTVNIILYIIIIIVLLYIRIYSFSILAEQ